jgi:hypothetical protein
MKKIAILIGSAALLLGSYQAQAQGTNTMSSPKMKRMFFYPSQPDAAVIIRQELVLSPNPANASVEFKLPGQSGALVSDSFNLQVIDKQGVQVIDRRWQGEKLDVTGLAAGMYVVTLRNGKQTFTQKLVVVRD